MTDMDVRFMHPVDSRILTVTVDDTMTAREAVNELITNQFVEPNPHGYQLGIKGGALIPPDAAFQGLTLKPEDVVRVIPATDAG